LKIFFHSAPAEKQVGQGIMSMHTTNVLQTLIQYFGALLLRSTGQPQQQQNSLLLDLDPEYVPTLPPYAASEYLFRKLLDVKGL